MKLAPRYDGDPIIAIDGPADDQLVPVVRQRRRMETMLAALTDEQWQRTDAAARSGTRKT